MTRDGSRILTPAPPLKASAFKRLAALAIPDEADLVLVGDSLAAAWPADLLAAARPGLRALNLGLPGDRIQNTLWRIEQGRADHLRPREVVVVLGTNNLSDGDGPAAIAGGLAALVDRLDRLWGRPAFVLATIPPRGRDDGATEAGRLELNALLARMRSDRLRLLASDAALAAAGPASLLDAFAEDGLHLGRIGYERLTAALAVIPAR